MLKRLMHSFRLPARRAWKEKADHRISSWSGTLQGWFQRYNRKRQMGILVIFCLLTCSAYTIILCQAFGGKNISTPVFRAIKVPGHVMETGEPAAPHINYWKEAQSAIVQFRHYADSLQGSASGKLVLDSLQKQWPGIMDTLGQMEKLYHLK